MLLVFIYLFSIAIDAAVFNPATVADLIADINTANINDEDDIIDLRIFK